MIQNWKFQRGDIFFTRFDNAIGSEQSGNRPAVVLQNDVGNFYSPTLIVATLTSKAAKKYTQPTHCLLVNDFLSVPSIVQAEQIFTVDKSRVLKYLGHLTPEEMSRVDDAVRASLALNPMGSIQRLPPIIRSTAAYAPPEVVDGKPPIYPYTPIKSSFEDAGSVEDMMLYTELEAAVHAMIQRLEYSFTFNPSLLTIPKRKQQVAEESPCLPVPAPYVRRSMLPSAIFSKHAMCGTPATTPSPFPYAEQTGSTGSRPDHFSGWK